MRCVSILRGSMVFLLFSVAVYGQESPPVTKNQIAWSQDFLRTMYPGLDGKKYVLTVETYLAYDQPGGLVNWLQMDVGEGAKDWPLGYRGGCAGAVIPSPLPWPAPPDLAPPTPSSPQVRPESPSKSRYETDCKPGPIYPKQFLTAGFSFDKIGALVNFGADGEFINDRQADNAVYAIVHAHPEMTYSEIVATLKQHGIKYGPSDKEQFIKDLPLKQLEPFLGELRILSVSFHPLDKDPDPASWIGSWPNWTVKVQGTTKEGAKVPYEMHFNHLNGYLTGILDCRTSPWCNR
jgi:hypothetical protein